MKLSGLIIETSTVHSTKSARPLSIVKFEFQGDNDYNFIILKGGGRLLCVRSLLLLPDLWSVNIVLTFIHGNDKSKLNR